MLPKFRICDCCGKNIPLDDGSIHTEDSGRICHIKPVKMTRNKSAVELFGIVNLIACIGDRHTVTTNETNYCRDLCDECKLMILENAVEHQKWLVSKNAKNA